MPTVTPNIGLEAFILGDTYSASVDKRRFTSIDKHMAFISDVIGEGVVEGWTISQDGNNLSIIVSPGMGMINKVITRTFGPLESSLKDDNFVNVWMRRRPGVIGEFSGFSDVQSLDHTDNSAPSLVSDLSVSNVTIDSINLSWTAVSAFDFDKYEIQRRTSDDNWQTIVEITDSSTSDYLDEGLEDNTEYQYRYRVFDKTGNSSSFSSVLSETTKPDLSPPADPTSIEVTPANNALHLLWRPVPVGSVEYYKIETTPVDLENNPTGQTVNQFVDSDLLYTTISDLENAQKYRLIIKSVSDTDVESSGVQVFATPEFFFGPKDVEQISITDKEGDDVISDIVLRVEWTSIDDPYDNSPPAVSHEVRLEEFDGENSDIIQSVWIEVPDQDFREFKIFQFTNNNGQVESKSIEPRTKYFITVRAIDDNGNTSVGKIATYTTRTFKAPNPVRNFNVEQQQNQSLTATWFNSDSIFLRNRITVEIVDLDNPSVVDIVEDNTDIGRSDRYILTSYFVRSNAEYTFTVVVEDEFGNKSETRSASFSIPDLNNLPRPNPPSQVLGVAGDGAATLTWNRPATRAVSGFTVYRSVQRAIYNASDFQRIETVPGDMFTYTDYEVSNGTSYVYFVTTVDVYGRESLNPVDDGFFDYSLTFLTPSKSGQLDNPSNLTLSKDVAQTGVDLSWNIIPGQFDGYEIFRSIDNKFSFEKIDTVAPSVTTYNDEESLVKDATYYYIVRAFRSEADLFVTESDVTVSGGLLIGTVETDNGNVSIDQSSLRNIHDLEDPVRERTRDILASHTHEFFTEIDDRRINLGDQITVSNWTTTDFQNYFTTTNITNTTTFDVLLNGEPAGGFDVLFNLDKQSKRLSFEVPLAPSNFASPDEEVVFEEQPSVSVVFDGLTEIQGKLPRQRLENVSAQQVSVGLVRNSQLPPKDHEGRRRERLIPSQISTLSLDNGFRFAPIERGQSVGSALTWYDVILAEGQAGDVLIASTSDGIYKSDDFGLNWTRVFNPSTPVIKFFYSSSIDFYFGLSNRGVLGSSGENQGGFTVWTEMRGVENNQITSDIVEDDNENIFVSGDLGVFKLQEDVGRDFFFWEQTPIFGPRSTESYAMLSDSFRNRVIVSNELGIFETKNAGESWDFSEEMPDQRPIWDFWQTNDGTIFAVTDFIVWRRKIGEESFQRIAILQDVDVTRKLVEWRDRLYITTNLGCFVSVPDSDIFSDEDISFELAFPQMNINSIVAPPTLLRIIDNTLFVGTEERLFASASPGNLSLMSEIKLGTIPTIYVNGVEQTIGFRYSTSQQDLRNVVAFDERKAVNDQVTIANQYKRFQAPNKGWTDTNFASGVFVYLNGRVINEYSVAERPAIAMSELRYPFYNDRNAHKEGADLARAMVDSANESLLSTEGNPAEGNQLLVGFTKENVINSMYAIERFLSQLYPETRVIQRLDEDGNVVTNDNGEIIFDDFKVPDFRVALLTGKRTFSDMGFSSFGTYIDQYGDSTDIGTFGSEINGVGVGLPPEGDGNDPSSGGTGRGIGDIPDNNGNDESNDSGGDDDNSADDGEGENGDADDGGDDSDDNDGGNGGGFIGG